MEVGALTASTVVVLYYIQQQPWPTPVRHQPWHVHIDGARRAATFASISLGHRHRHRPSSPHASSRVECHRGTCPMDVGSGGGEWNGACESPTGIMGGIEGETDDGSERLVLALRDLAGFSPPLQVSAHLLVRLLSESGWMGG